MSNLSMVLRRVRGCPGHSCVILLFYDVLHVSIIIQHRHARQGTFSIRMGSENGLRVLHIRRYQDHVHVS